MNITRRAPARRINMGERTYDVDGRLRPGTLVETVEHVPVSHDWAPDILAMRRWGVRGTVMCVVEDADDAFYEVLHADGAVRYYEPAELEVISE